MTPKRQVLFNTKEAAQYLDNRISWKTLERWRHENHGPKYIKLGHGQKSRILYTEKALLEFLENSERSGQDDFVA